MPGPAYAALRPSAAGSLAYAWPADVVMTACTKAWRPTASDALIAAIHTLVADPRLGSLAPPADRAIAVGTQSGAMAETLRFAREIHEVGAALVNPALFPVTVINAASGLAAIEHHCEGPNITLCNGSGSALDALVYAADMVCDGRAAVVFAGGFETVAEGALAADAALAVVGVVMTREGALRAGASWRAGLIATASAAAAADGSAEDFGSALVSAAAQAGRLALASWPGAKMVRFSTAVQGLAALADTADAADPVTALVACEEDTRLGTALILARSRSGELGAGPERAR